MRTLIWSQAKGPIKRVLGTCMDSVVLELANEAQERLLNRKENPVGSLMRYRVCTSDSCLVWPRQIRAIHSFWICKTPGTVRDAWYEAIGYNEGGWGLLDSDSHPGTQLADRQTTCCFTNISATTAAPKKIQAVASNVADNGKKITLRYVDSNGNRVYTSIGGVIQEGEQLTLSTSGTLTASNVLSDGLYHVVKESTNYPVRLYSYDVTTSLQDVLMAVYEPSETVPIYRASLVPGMSDMPTCEDSDSDCATRSVTILAKLQHVPVILDNDPFVLGNLSALKLMCKGIRMEEQQETQQAEYYFTSAAREIDGELSSYTGDGVNIAVRHADVETAGAAVFSPLSY